MLVDPTLDNCDEFCIKNDLPLDYFYKRLGKGIYNAGNFHLFIQDKTNEYPGLGELNAYGVCDDPDQVLKSFDFEGDERKFCIAFGLISKKDQPRDGGWRWHKWGPYIGKHIPMHEYLYDEPEIDEVVLYHVYEIL